MEIGKVATQQQLQPTSRGTLPSEELKRLTDVFQILIQIDQRERRKSCKK